MTRCALAQMPEARLYFSHMFYVLCMYMLLNAFEISVTLMLLPCISLRTVGIFMYVCY